MGLGQLRDITYVLHSRILPYVRAVPVAAFPDRGLARTNETERATSARSRRSAAQRPGTAQSARLRQQLLDAGDALDEVLVAQGVRQPQIARRAERLARNDRDLGLVQDQRGQLDRVLRALAADLLAEQPLHRRVGVERALGLGADDAVDLVEHPHDRLAAAVEGLPHLRDGVQVTRHRGQRRDLRHVRHVRRGVRLEVRRRLHDVLRADDPADPPARHGVRLRDTVDHDALVAQLREDRGQRRERRVAVDEVLVDLVRQDPQAVLDGPAADRLGVLARCRPRRSGSRGRRRARPSSSRCGPPPAARR